MDFTAIVSIFAARLLFINMSKELFDRLNSMSVDEILNIDFEPKKDVISEDFERPYTIEETESYFLQEGFLTMEEMDILMENKIKELWEDDGCSSA